MGNFEIYALSRSIISALTLHDHNQFQKFLYHYFRQLLLNMQRILLDLFQSLGLHFHSTKYRPSVPRFLLVYRADFNGAQIDFTCINSWSVNIRIWNFTFMWPCIVTDFFIIKPTRCTNFTNLFWHETLHKLDSSSAQHQEFIRCTHSNGVCHTGL